MIKTYEQLNDSERSKLSKAWADIAEGLGVYETVTGAYNLDDILYEELWETIGYQKTDEVG